MGAPGLAGPAGRTGRAAVLALAGHAAAGDLAAELAFEGELLSGRATFAGSPVPLTSPTPEGKRVRSFVYLDRLAGGSWQRIGGVATRANGTFRRLLKASELGSRYRAVVTGPNIGTTLAPDGVQEVRSVR